MQAWYNIHMKKYHYKDKRNGKRIESDKPLNDENLVLVTAIRDGRMKAHEVRQK